MKKTLFISDLDGTLLTSKETLSPFTIQAINHLTSQGMMFSYATARSYRSASKVTDGLTVHLPIIVNNGVFILENITWKRLHASYYTKDEAAHILDTLNQQNVHPLVYTYLHDKQKYSYRPECLSRGILHFLDAHPNDPRHRPVAASQMLDGDLFYFLCIDDADKLFPCYQQLKNAFHCVYQIDMYDGEQWLEIMPKGATKASAALKLKEMLGCEKIVAFGDGINDLSLFAIADECYAMENANENVKQAATAVIGSNEEDGVARWLLENWKN